MITGEIKNKIDKILADMWTGGITNPLTAIEQLTYLMFIRSLDKKDLEYENMESLTGEAQPKIFKQNIQAQAMRWSKFKDQDAHKIYNTISQKVFPFIKSLNNGKNETPFSKYMQTAVFLFPRENEQLLQKIVIGLDDLYEHDLTGLDMQGDLYEYMLSKLSTAGHNGQFRTPKHIRDMMVNLLAPTPNDKICDPACGTAGFLISFAEYIKQNYGNNMTTEQWKHFSSDMFSGFDTDNTMLRISAMNLILHSITNPNIQYKDSISKQNKISSEYDIILANPPFTGSVDISNINEDLKDTCNTKKTELLFLVLFLRILKTGGKCGCIVPKGVLFGNTNAHKSLRRELVENNKLQAIISMPPAVFKPYAGVETSILIFTKTGKGGTDKVWFYDMKADGFSLDDKRIEQKESDIPDIISRFHNLEDEIERKRTDQSFFVDKSEIANNNYDLSINRYKETIYEKIEYDPPKVILDRLAEIDKTIRQKMEALRNILDE